MWWSWVVLGGVCVCGGFFFPYLFFPSLITRWLCQWCTFCPRVTVLTHCIVSIEKQKSPSPPILLHNNWEGVSVVLRSLARRLLHSKLFANEISDNFFFFRLLFSIGHNKTFFKLHRPKGPNKCNSVIGVDSKPLHMMCYWPQTFLD